MTTRPPLVLLHPLGSDHRFWDPVVEELAVPDLIAWDLPGHGGQRALAPGLGLGAVTDALVDQLRRRGMSQVAVAGISYGGLVAQDLAVRYPELVTRLALVDTVATYPEPMREMWRERAQKVRAAGMETLVEPTLTAWFSQAHRNAHPAQMAQVREVLLATSVEGYARSCEVLAGADLSARSTEITSPALIVCGTEDGEPFREAAAWFGDRIDGAELLWLVGAGHASVLEQPATFARAMSELLDQGSA